MPLYEAPSQIPIRIRPYELRLLTEYLKRASQEEGSIYLRGYLRHAQAVFEEALKRALCPIQLEHDREQVEALLEDVRNGRNPLAEH
jgi:hypothetical protein